MIAGRRKRSLVALTALVGFLSAGAADAGGLDPCPHHDALPVAEHEASAGPDHQHEALHSQGHGQGSEEHQGHGPCNCVGSCDAGGSAPIAVRAPGRTVAAMLPSWRAPLAAAHRAAPVRHGRWIPYLPNAPPLSV